jgi:hypothetical protein
MRAKDARGRRAARFRQGSVTPSGHSAAGRAQAIDPTGVFDGFRSSSAGRNILVGIEIKRTR